MIFVSECKKLKTSDEIFSGEKISFNYLTK